jgi:hypothetical protein
MFGGRITLTDDLILAIDGAALQLRPADSVQLGEALTRKGFRRMLAEEAARDTGRRRAPRATGERGRR